MVAQSICKVGALKDGPGFLLSYVGPHQKPLGLYLQLATNSALPLTTLKCYPRGRLHHSLITTYTPFGRLRQLILNHFDNYEFPRVVNGRYLVKDADGNQHEMEWDQYFDFVE